MEWIKLSISPVKDLIDMLSNLCFRMKLLADFVRSA